MPTAKKSCGVVLGSSFPSDSLENVFYEGVVYAALKRLLPMEFSSSSVSEVVGAELDGEVPLVAWRRRELGVCVSLLCHEKPHVGSFFYEMVTRWLLPGKQMDVSSFFFTQFSCAGGGGPYLLSEIVLFSEDEEDIACVCAFLPMMAEEIRAGVISASCAHRILEIRGLSGDEKYAFIQKRIASLIQRKPMFFGDDLFLHMQHFLVTCKEEFKARREWKCLARILCLFYLFRRWIRRAVETVDRRYVHLKLLQGRLQTPLGVKEVLSVFVGIRLLHDDEVFEQRHLLKAIQTHFPYLHAIPDSFVLMGAQEDRILTLYLEVEKEGGTKLSFEEISALRRRLPADLKAGVEKLQKPLFMPRNEEEVMRNILTLSHELRSSKDLSQVIVSFDRQSEAGLVFTVILLRVLTPKTLSLARLFELSNTCLSYSVDWIKQVGWLRKKHPKEASVFSVTVPKDTFLREDYSVDLLKARQLVISELSKVIGAFRDYNGGMFSKQREVRHGFFSLFKGEMDRGQELLLENFFHSIYPIEWRGIANPAHLKNFFDLFMRVKAGEDRVAFHEEGVYVVLPLPDKAVKAALDAHVVGEASELLTLLFEEGEEALYGGYLFFSQDKERQNAFFKKVEGWCRTIEQGCGANS